MKLKAKMNKTVEQLKEERQDNEDMLPKDTHLQGLEVAKEQVLNLSDKFDFLIGLLAKSNKLT